MILLNEHVLWSVYETHQNATNLNFALKKIKLTRRTIWNFRTLHFIYFYLIFDNKSTVKIKSLKKVLIA